MLKLKLEVINLRNFSEEIKDLNKTNKFPKDHVEQQGLTVQHELHFYHVLRCSASGQIKACNGIWKSGSLSKRMEPDEEEHQTK